TAVGRETGYRVDLIEHQTPGRLQEHVHPGEATTTEGAVDAFRGVLDAALRLCVNAGGHVDLRGDEVVLFRVVKEVALYLDLICAARGEFGVTHDSAADLKAGYGLLDDHLA